MRRIREVLRLRAALGQNISAIASGGRMSRSTVREYLQRAAAAKIDASVATELTDEALEAALFPPAEESKRPLPEWAKIDEDLRRHKHVTRKLLWLEYKANHPDGYEFSQFNLLLSAWQKSSGRGLSMRQVHRAGEAVQVDYAGDTFPIMDLGVERAVQTFVACLPCSGLIYAEGTWTQGQEDWLSAHVRLFSFMGGVTAKVVPDNAKVGVTHPSYWDPVINASYAALIKHYGTAVVPARVRKPRDKPAVEGSVVQAYRWLLAPLRNRQFFSLAEFNKALWERLAELNDRPMAPPREGSRRSLFEAVERAALKPLPAEPFVIGEWQIDCKVNVDYHIVIDRHYLYSVPYALVRKSVDAFLTATSVQISHRGQRVATHPRLTGAKRYSTLDEHMPPAHSAMANRTPDWVRSEAAKVGIATVAYVERLLTGRDHVEQGIRSCLGILRLASKYPTDRMEAACQRALVAGIRSSRFVEDLLKTGRPIPEAVGDDGPGRHANLHPSGTFH
jgi:transposase